MVYTAPEIISSLHDVTPRFAFKGDIFSLGTTLFELFTGTVLGNQLFDAQFQEDLLQHMAVIPRDKRREAYDGFITQMADSRLLPSIEAYAPSVRRCVLPIINDLYKNMAALDYRKRTGGLRIRILEDSTGAHCASKRRQIEEMAGAARRLPAKSRT